MISLIRLAERQGRFSGDLNILQQSGLVWIMNDEITQQTEVERVRTENLALATNAATSSEFLKHLFEHISPEPEEPQVLEEEWVTPNDVKEVEDFLRGWPS